MSLSDYNSSRKPRILITNDDDIRVVAPDSARSGQSGAITSGVPLFLEKIDSFSGAEFYACNGTPVDCVKLALHAFSEFRPDLILSGINHGSNAGVSILYSGTMGAVLEGCVVNIPSVGFSLLSHDADADFSSCRDYASCMSSGSGLLVRRV